MKISHRIPPMFTLIACLLSLATSLRAQTPVRYKSSPIGSTVKIEGSSTIHDWKMTGRLIGGYLEVPAGVTLDPSKAEQPGVKDGKLEAKAEVSIPVSSMQSGTQGMDEVMQAAMNVTDYPRIQYHLTEMLLKQPHAAGTPLLFDTKGELAVAGVTNKISMPVSIDTTEKTKLKVIGSTPLLMTDYNVRPPVKAGIFKTTNNITVSFEWVIVPPKGAEAKAQ
jgi:hypothetical protein